MRERKLWAAVLCQAVEDLRKPDEYPATKRWFLNSRNEGIGSFLWICITLEMDPDSILKKVQKIY